MKALQTSTAVCEKCGNRGLVEVGQESDRRVATCECCRTPPRMLAAAGVPPAFCGCSLQTFEARTQDQQRVLDALRAWVAAGCAAGLYLVGPVGTGKTHLAVAAMLELLLRHDSSREFAGRYVSARELVLSLREAYSGNGNTASVGRLLRECSEVGALVLDDLAAGKGSDFIAQCFDVLVDRAYSRRRPLLIVTSNVDIAQLGRKLDGRVADRLRELCVEVRVGGPSYRRRIAARRTPGGILISEGVPLLTAS